MISCKFLFDYARHILLNILCQGKRG